MNEKEFDPNSRKLAGFGLCLNEIRTNPQDADLRCAATPKGCAPWMAQINNLAANLERSPLTHSYGYVPAGDRPILFGGTPDRRFRLSFVPFMQYAG